MSAPPPTPRARRARKISSPVTSLISSIQMRAAAGHCVLTLSVDNLNCATPTGRGTVMNIAQQFVDLAASAEAIAAPIAPALEESMPEPTTQEGEAIAPQMHGGREFLAEHCEFAYQAFVPQAELLEAYRAWRRGLGETPDRSGERDLIAAVIAAGGRRSRSRRINGKQQRTLDGLCLKSSAVRQIQLVPRNEEFGIA